jgi:hypothetical protein
MPALLIEVVQQCVVKDVFQKGGLEKTVAKAMQRGKDIATLANEMSKAMGPCCVCRKRIRADQPATKEGQRYRHAACNPKASVS